jgi:phytoene desaturase
MQKKSISIIWWGIGWLATAVLMAKDGHDVSVYEKNECLGWRASIFSEKWYTFDMGPSWYLMPDLFEKFFKEIGENIHDHLDLAQLSPSYKVFYPEDNKIKDMNVYADIDRMADQFEQMEVWSGQKFRDFLKTSGEQYHIGMDFALRNYDSIMDFFKRDVAIKGMKLNIITTIDKYVARFFKTPIIQKIMQYTTVFLGTAPNQTPAFYNIMSHVDFAMGVRYPQGGLHAVAQALVKIGTQYGVKYYTDSEVIKVESWKWKVESMTVSSPLLKGDWGGFVEKTITSDLFIVNADQARFETAMIPSEYQTYKKPYREKKTFAPSGFIIYAGIDKKLPQLEHHNLYFNDNRAESFWDIYDRHVLSPDPSLYICAPSRTDPNVAPAGKENLFILVPITNGIDISTEEKKSYRDKIRKIVEEMTGENLIDHIEYERIFEIQDFKDRYNARKGTALGLGHTMMQTASFRPNNYSKKLSNLFYVWHNTNPGIGVPMVIVSAMLVKERIEQKMK